MSRKEMRAIELASMPNQLITNLDLRYANSYVARLRGGYGQAK